MSQNTTCLIWSNEHSAWWAPNECGYSKKLAGAGRYSHERAIAIVERAQDGRQNMPDGSPPELVVRESDVLLTIRW